LAVLTELCVFAKPVLLFYESSIVRCISRKDPKFRKGAKIVIQGFTLKFMGDAASVHACQL